MTKKQSNHDARGNCLNGQIVNFNACCGDIIKIDGRLCTVTETYPDYLAIEKGKSDLRHCVDVQQKL